MSESKLFIPVLLGTVRQERESEQVAKFLLRLLEQDGRFDTQLFDPRNLDLPMDQEGEILADRNPEFRDAIARADGMLIVVPEYNHGYPGSLKRMFDILYTQYRHKAVGLAGVSSGIFGGARAIEALLHSLRKTGLSIMAKDLYFPKVQDAFTEDGRPRDEGVYKRVEVFLDELAWLATTLRWGREHFS